MSKASWMCRAASLAATAVGAWVVLEACVTPSDGYDDYLNRTSGLRGTPAVVSDAAPVEASLPDGGFSSAYALVCYPSFAQLSDVLRFAVDVTFVPSTSGAGGTITMTINPVAVGGTTIADTVTPSIGPVSSPVDANGNFQLDIKNLVVPAAANPISPAPAQFDTDTYIPGVFQSEAAFCGGLDGDLVEPIQINFCPAANVCLFSQATDPNTAFPTYTKSDFVCPGLPVPSGC